MVEYAQLASHYYSSRHSIVRHRRLGHLRSEMSVFFDCAALGDDVVEVLRAHSYYVDFDGFVERRRTCHGDVSLMG